VLLPAQFLSRRADAGAVIGAALEAAAAGAGFRKAAQMLGRAASTVRGWLRRFAGRAGQVREFFTVLLARTSPDPVMPAGAAGPAAPVSSGALPPRAAQPLAGLTSATRTEGDWNTTATTGRKRTLVRLRQQAEKLQV